MIEEKKTEFFTDKERNDIFLEIKNLSDVGIVIFDRDTKGKLDKSPLSDRSAFFAKAKMWRIVQGIVRAVFLDQIVAGKLYFTDEKGGKYFLNNKATLFQESEKSKIDLTLLEETQEGKEEEENAKCS